MLFGRVGQLYFGKGETFSLGELRFAFRCVASTRQDPNASEVTLYNASDAILDRALTKGASCTLYAGYAPQPALLFAGDVVDVISRWEGVDRVTKITLGDGARVLRDGHISLSLAPGASHGDALRAVCKRLGLPVPEGIEALTTKPPGGITLHGKARDVLNRLTQGADIDWSIQRGKLVIKAPQNTGNALVLDEASGLLDVPQYAKGKGKEGPKVSLKCLLTPQLQPHAIVRVQSRSYSAFVRVQSVVHDGDTGGEAWHTLVEGAPL